MRLAIIAYVVPFIFVYHPVLIWSGSGWQILLATVTAVLGCIAIGSALMGFMVTKLNWFMRLVLLVASFALLMPGARTDIGGFALLMAIWLIDYFRSRSVSKIKEEPAPGS